MSTVIAPNGRHQYGRVQTDEEGRFTYSFYRSGKYKLIIQHRLYDHKTVEVDIFEGKEKEILIKLEVGNFLAGTIKDVEGKPVAGIGLNLISFPRGATRIAPKYTRTDKLGRYQLSKLKTGSYRLSS